MTISLPGQPRAEVLLRSAILEPAHAYLLHGPPGTGKRDASRAFAALLLGCDVRRIVPGSHPDLAMIEPEGESLLVDQIHELSAALRYRPQEALRCVGIVDEADRLNRDAANAFLKTLEEPPGDVVMILVADDVSRVLPTVRSRCQPIAFPPLSASAVAARLEADGVAMVEAAAIGQRARGDLAFARRLAADPAVRTWIAEVETRVATALSVGLVQEDAAVQATMAGINMLALVLTSSRSGLGLALIGILVLQLVMPAAPRMRLIGLFSVVPAVIIGFRIANWTAFTAPEQSVQSAGLSLVIWLLVSALLGALIAAIAVKLIPGGAPYGPQGRASHRTLLIAATGAIMLVIALVIKTGGPSGMVTSIREGFTGPIGQAGVRIGIGSNMRDHWWATAWDGFQAEPWYGWGAGTFRLLEQITQNPSYVTDSAHNTLLEAISGTGLLGGVPFIIGGIALLVMTIAGVRHARVGDEIGATVIAVGGIAFIVQGLVDVNWSLVVPGVIVYAAIGAIAPKAHRQRRVVPVGRAITGALCVGLIFAGLLAVPTWLSARDTARSNDAFIENPQLALNLAASAHRFNPLGIDPLLAQADAQQALGDAQGAQATLLEAIRLEPTNYEPWLAYGTYLAYAWNHPAAGRAALEHALKLSGDDASVHVVLDTLPVAG